MVLIALLLVVGVAGFLLFRWFRRQPHTRSTWKTAILFGLGLGLTRATLACFGWYVVEHTGGPAQVPAFALSMLAWPEGALLPSPGPGLTPVSTYISLFVLLVVSTMVIVAAIAAAARRRRGHALNE